MERRRPRRFWKIVAIVGMLGAVTIAYSELKSLAQRGDIAEVTLRGPEASGRLRSVMPIGTRGERSEYFVTRLPDIDDPNLLPLLEEQDVSVTVEEEAAKSPLVALLLAVLPWLLLFLRGRPFEIARLMMLQVVCSGVKL